MNNLANTPNHNPLYGVELEQQLLGALLCNNERYNEISGDLNSDHFYEPVHADIFRNIATRISKEHLASPVTLKVDMENHGGLKELGGAAYIARLAGASIAGFQVKYYADEIVQLWQRRTLDKALLDASEAIRGGQGADDTRASLEILLQGLGESRDAPRSVSFLSASTQAIMQINDAFKTGLAGIPTGISELDRVIGGLVNQDFTIVAGDTSMGKTSLATVIAYNVAKAGYGVGFASLEMSEAALATRINAIESGIAYHKMRNGQITKSEFDQLIHTSKAQEALPIRIYNSRVRTVAAILSETKRAQHMMKPNGDFKGLGLLIVDYIQLIRGSGGSIYERVTEVSSQMKAMAKVLDIPVIGIAQLSRGFKKDNKNPRPQLSDLKDSSQLEQDADNVIFCYRDHYYLSREKEPTGVEELVDHRAALDASKSRMELIVAKVRMGAIGNVNIGCDMATNRFWDLDAPSNQSNMEGF